MTTYPCRYYGCGPAGETGLVFGLRLARPLGPDECAALIAALPGTPGPVHVMQGREDDPWDLLGLAEEDPGSIHALLWDDWVITYQFVVEEVDDGLDGDTHRWRDAFQSIAALHGLVEVVSLFGSFFDWEPDPWTAWSLQKGRPTRVPDLGETRWESPYDAAESPSP